MTRRWLARRPRRTPALSCQELVELVTDYLEGALPSGDRTRFEEHVAACPGCQAYVDQMVTVVRVVGATRPLVLGRAAQESLLEAFRDWRDGTVG